MKRKVVVASLLLMTGASFGPIAPAFAQDVPAKLPPKAVVTSSGGWYVWADGPPWQSMRPLGSDAVPNTLSVTGDAPSAPAEAPISGPPDLLAPAPNVMQGGIGYVFPERTFSSALGSKVRAEFGASETQASVALTPGRQNPLVGDGSNGTIVGGCAGCNFPLTSDYSRRQTNFKAASDFNVHGVTVSPSVTVFGASNRQNFAPAVANRTGSTMQWNDVGAKIGLDTKLDIAPKMTVGLGGNVGVAHRDSKLVPNASAPGSSAPGATSAVTAPLLGNAEAKVVYKPLTELELKTFGGVQGYDNRVPSMALTPGGSAAGIKFTPEHGYYAGAGLTYRFGSQ